MKISDILRIKGSILYTIHPDSLLQVAIHTMAEHDIGSLMVMEYGELIGILSFREVIKFIADNGNAQSVTVRKAMEDHPITCTLGTDIEEIQRIMLEKHARYTPVIENKVLMGVISFYDMTKAIIEAKDFENNMLKAYIRDWPTQSED
jgi:CBS domain-containing protein